MKNLMSTLSSRKRKALSTHIPGLPGLPTNGGRRKNISPKPLGSYPGMRAGMNPGKLQSLASMGA